MELTDSRSFALAGANTAAIFSPGSYGVNPASGAGSKQLYGASLAKHPEGISSGHLVGYRPFSEHLGAGIGLDSYDYGTFKATDVDGNPSSSFTGNENLLTLYVAGRLVEGLDGGVAVKYGWWRLDGETASAAAFDAGIVWQTGYEQLRVGAAWRNVGKQQGSSDADIAPLAGELSLGVSNKLQHLPLTIFAAAHLRPPYEGDIQLGNGESDPGLAFGVGGEFEIKPKRAEHPIYLRIGYRSIGEWLRLGYQGDITAGFSFGVGFTLKQIGIDYSFLPMGALGSVHRFGISTSL